MIYHDTEGASWIITTSLIHKLEVELLVKSSNFPTSMAKEEGKKRRKKREQQVHMNMAN